VSDINWTALQQATRATCAELHTRHLRDGLIIRPRRDPGQYRFSQVFPVLYTAFDAGIVKEVQQ